MSMIAEDLMFAEDFRSFDDDDENFRKCLIFD